MRLNNTFQLKRIPENWASFLDVYSNFHSYEFAIKCSFNSKTSPFVIWTIHSKTLVTRAYTPGKPGFAQPNPHETTPTKLDFLFSLSTSGPAKKKWFLNKTIFVSTWRTSTVSLASVFATSRCTKHIFSDVFGIIQSWPEPFRYAGIIGYVINNNFPQFPLKLQRIFYFTFLSAEVDIL